MEKARINTWVIGMRRKNALFISPHGILLLNTPSCKVLLFVGLACNCVHASARKVIVTCECKVLCDCSSADSWEGMGVGHAEGVTVHASLRSCGGGGAGGVGRRPCTWNYCAPSWWGDPLSALYIEGVFFTEGVNTIIWCLEQ
jgi:hypothetical protein